MYLCAASLAPGFASEAALHGRLGSPLSADQGEAERKSGRTRRSRPGAIGTVVCQPGGKPGLALP